MGRQATLVIVGNLAQALGAVIEHQIMAARSAIQDPTGLKLERGSGCLTRVTIDGERYNSAIAFWLNETKEDTLEPGTLLRVRWCDAA